MSNELLTVIEYLSPSRSISREIIVKALENAILSASRKSIHPASDLRIKIDPPTGKIQAIAILEVVDGVPMNSDQITIAAAQEVYPDVQVGEKIEWEVTPSNFGRIAAQAARQNLTQQLRRSFAAAHGKGLARAQLAAQTRVIVLAAQCLGQQHQRCRIAALTAEG